MKKIVSVAMLLLISLLLFATPALAQDGGGGQVVFGGSYTLKSGEKLDGDLVVFGGNAVLEEGSRVDGSVAIFGGNLEIAGEVDGDLTVIGGNANLQETAVIEGDLASIGGNVNRAEGAVVRGKTEKVGNGGGITFPGILPIPPLPATPPIPSPPHPSVVFSPVRWLAGEVFEAIIWTLALMAIGLLVTLFLPQPVDLTARTITQYPLLSLGVGFLTLIAGTIVGTVLILLLCMGLFVLLFLAVALLFGWIAAGYLVGQRLMEALKKSWSPLWSSAIGVGFITLLAHAPFCLGFLFSVIVASMGLGAVILTRFGSTPYIPSTRSSPRPTPPAPPSAPPPPAPPASTRETEPPEEDVPEEWEVVDESEPEDAASGGRGVKAESEREREALSTNPPWAYGPFFSAWSYSGGMGS
jgi:hypothetical protein